MTEVSSLPLAGLENFGTIKTTGLQLHTIRQVSTINAPNLTGSNGDLILDSGVSTRSNNGHLKIKGGYQGISKIDVLEAGVWDKTENVGVLTNSIATAQTLEEHLSIGTLMTGVKIPVLGSGVMDVSKVYALRNVGTTGHVAWASINDIGGDLAVSGKLSVAADTVLSADLSVGGHTEIVGETLMRSTLDVEGNIKTDSSISAGGRLDLANQMIVGGIAIMESSLSVASSITSDSLLSVGTSVISEDAIFRATLSVGGTSQFESHISVSTDVSLNDLHVRGRVFPFSNGLSVGGDVIFADALSVNGTSTFADKLSVAGDVMMSGQNVTVKGASLIDLGEPTSTINVQANALTASTPLKLEGHLSVGNASAILFDTPLLSVQGSFFTESDATLRGKLNVAQDLSCGSSMFLGSALTVGASTNLGSDLAVNQNLSVGGGVTIIGDLNVQGTTTTISSTTLTVQDKTLELGVVESPSDSLAVGSGLIIKGDSDKTITYTRSATSSATTQQLSAFQLSEDLVLGKKSTPFEDSLASRLVDAPRSQVLHLGDMSSTDGHWMVVSNIADGTLQFWYGQDISDDQTLDAMPASSAKLAFEIRKPE
tara:strand:+ start:6406 stop:8199 length:1794 start_codon:yes stop_codon:yes gene_type:complete